MELSTQVIISGIALIPVLGMVFKEKHFVMRSTAQINGITLIIAGVVSAFLGVGATVISIPNGFLLLALGLLQIILINTNWKYGKIVGSSLVTILVLAINVLLEANMIKI